MVSIHVLYDGYSYKKEGSMFANCTCTLIKGDKNIVVDCMTAWDADKLINALATYKLDPTKIDYIICTHGHSDHVGNLNLFKNAIHIVGFTISRKDEFFDHSFDKGEPYVINENVQVIPTPGHTVDDVSVYIKTTCPESKKKILYVVAGDLFEKEEDISNPALWKDQSADPETQKKSRYRVASEADIIIPGHGPPFSVSSALREEMRSQLEDIPASN